MTFDEWWASPGACELFPFGLKSDYEMCKIIWEAAQQAKQ